MYSVIDRLYVAPQTNGFTFYPLLAGGMYIVSVSGCATLHKQCIKSL